MPGADYFEMNVASRFPELRKMLEADRGMLHHQMRTLASAVRTAIAHGDTGLPLGICAFLDEALSNQTGRGEIEHAIAISFVQPFDLRRSAAGKLVLRAMPGSVRRILLEQEERAGVW